MRSAAAREHIESIRHELPVTQPKISYRASLVSGDAFLLDGASRTSINDAFFQLIRDSRPTWPNVESLAGEFVEAGALLGCGGDQVRITPCRGGNCTVSGRPVAVLRAPVVDEALEARFSSANSLTSAPIPTGIVLLCVEATSRTPRAKTVGDVLRADRVSSGSPELINCPVRVPASSVTIGIGDIHFCEPRDLRLSLEEATLAEARGRSAAILPGVYE